MNIYEKESYMKQKPSTLLGYHQISMKERKLMDVTGIKKLLSFDSELFTIDTTMGILTVRGMDLELKKQKAHYIIDNSFDLCYTYKQVDVIISKLLEMRK